MPENKAASLATPAAGGRAPMSDAEVICTWMEPRPTVNPEAVLKFRHFEMRWWVSRLNDSLTGALWRPRDLDLDALHEIEARLTDEQWMAYWCALLPLKLPIGKVLPAAIHATADEKLAALATVLRPIVEGRGGEVVEVAGEVRNG